MSETLDSWMLESGWIDTGQERWVTIDKSGRYIRERLERQFYRQTSNQYIWCVKKVGTASGGYQTRERIRDTRKDDVVKEIPHYYRNKFWRWMPRSCKRSIWSSIANKIKGIFCPSRVYAARGLQK